MKNIDGEMAYPHPIHKNALPHCDVFLDNGYTKEEMKLVNETQKILMSSGSKPAPRLPPTDHPQGVGGGFIEFHWFSMKIQ